MKRKQQVKMFWQRLHRDDYKLKILMLDADDEDFVENLYDCLEALESNVHPILIPSGSSGSYFVRNSQCRHIGVFKPKDEEPFAENNPKWPKFLQRFLCFCCYGRSCLIPLNGYLSEVAASLVDERLQLYIVPKTRVVKMASPAFFYPRRCCSAAEIHPKIGSYQLFIHGYKPAYDLVPGWELIGTIDPLTSIERKHFLFLFQKMCVLDYVIRNTDRTMDNWLIRYISDETLDIAAIDHGLAFPVKHPETATVLRPFVYGWANMDSAREFQPWNKELRDHLLSILTPMFVHRLCVEIKKLFMIDTTNNRFLINNQLKVFRGQIWNLRLALLENESPLKMIQRPLVVVSKRYRKYPTSDVWEECFQAKSPDYSGRRCC